jgi:methionyl-tRNA formyltransferase
VALVSLSRTDAVGLRRARRLFGQGRLLLKPSARDPALLERVRALQPDLLVSWFWTTRLPVPLIRAARLGGVGAHPSLLPRHRGRDAVRWSVKMRDPIAGGTVYWLGDAVDAGPIAVQGWCHVGPGDTAESLWREKLFPMGLRLVERVLDDLQAGRIVQLPQDERYATWEPSWERPPMFRPELGLIGPGLEGFEVVREASR